MIEFRDVHKSFGNLEVLKGINLNIEKGQVVTLISSVLEGIQPGFQIVSPSLI